MPSTWVTAPSIRHARLRRVTSLGPLRDLRLIQALTSQHRRLIAMLTGPVLDQAPGTVLRRERPPRRLRSRINTTSNR